MLTHNFTLYDNKTDIMLHVMHDDRTGDEVIIDLDNGTVTTYPDYVYEHIDMLNRGYTLWEVVDELETYDYLYGMHRNGYITDLAWDNIDKYNWHVVKEAWD